MSVILLTRHSHVLISSRQQLQELHRLVNVGLMELLGIANGQVLMSLRTMGRLSGILLLRVRSVIRLIDITFMFILSAQ